MLECGFTLLVRDNKRKGTNTQVLLNISRGFLSYAWLCQEGGQHSCKVVF